MEISKMTRECIKINKISGVKYKNIKQLWQKYDNDFSGKMEFEEFNEFVKEVRLNLGKLSILDIYHMIDSDNSGKIDFNEFVTYF